MDEGHPSGNLRPWTNAELHKLFSDYFNKLPGMCPVCGHEVSMMMDHQQYVTILSIRCRGCGNSSNVLS